MSLGFFSGDVSSSESEDEKDEAVSESEEKLNSQEKNDKNKLPPPDALFATVKRPTFLNDTGQIHVDWDKYAKSIDTPNEENIHERDNYAAIPPPPSDSSELSAPPVRYSQPSPSRDVDDESPSAAQDEPSTGKRPPLADDGASKKKQKVETFRQKEKKKRDLGMSSRGKNYVEEEKRVLREQYGPLGVGD